MKNSKTLINSIQTIHNRNIYQPNLVLFLTLIENRSFIDKFSNTHFSGILNQLTTQPTLHSAIHLLNANQEWVCSHQNTLNILSIFFSYYDYSYLLHENIKNRLTLIELDHIFDDFISIEKIQKWILEKKSLEHYMKSMHDVNSEVSDIVKTPFSSQDELVLSINSIIGHIKKSKNSGMQSTFYQLLGKHGVKLFEESKTQLARTLIGGCIDTPINIRHNAAKALKDLGMSMCYPSRIWLLGKLACIIKNSSLSSEDTEFITIVFSHIFHKHKLNYFLENHLRVPGVNEIILGYAIA